MNSEQIEKIMDIAATLASRAEEFDQVLVIYRHKDDGGKVQSYGSLDNDLEGRDALWMIETFKIWMLRFREEQVHEP